jgi:hypothetical protein
MRTAIEEAQEFVSIASAYPTLLGRLRGAFSSAKSRDIRIEVYTTTPGAMEIEDLKHYLDVKIAMPSKEILLESFKEVFQTPPELLPDELEPTRMLIMNIDGRESIGVFLPGDDTSQPWALHIRSRLVVMIQWQVVKTVLSGVEAMIQNVMQG